MVTPIRIRLATEVEYASMVLASAGRTTATTVTVTTSRATPAYAILLRWMNRTATLVEIMLTRATSGTAAVRSAMAMVAAVTG